MKTFEMTSASAVDQFEPMFVPEPGTPCEPDAGEPTTSSAHQELAPKGQDYFLSSTKAEKRAAYQKGFDAGERESLAKLSGKLDEQMNRWKRLLAAMAQRADAQLDSFHADMERRTLSLSVAIAEKILRSEVKVGREAVATRLAEALSLRGDDIKVIVRVNNDDLPLVTKLLERVRAELVADGDPPPGERLEITATPDLTPGDFVVELPSAIMDHTISGQLKKIEAELASLYEQHGR